ncbi:helix-turn-helix transcriptional regulator [Nonomuraea sp. KM90]|uniref:helix-turn-helix transcriptional regulator n=1 Tax=Nonomuraea sp. KM90 TaxID=3457428 RepID=UPI003FCC6A60
MLLILAGDPRARIRDIAATIGITERAVHGITNDLVQEGYVVRVREGRRNRYEIVPGGRLRHPARTPFLCNGHRYLGLSDPSSRSEDDDLFFHVGQVGRAQL